jgi:transcriptional regulator with XRE-family HTH domain
MEVNVERLKQLRREQVLSLRELEERSGVSYNTIWRIEDGRQGAHPRTIRKLAEALGVQPSELIREGYAWASAETAKEASPGAKTDSTWPATRSRRPQE